MNAALFPPLPVRRGLVLFLAPLTAFFLCQWVYGGSLLLAPGVIAANYLCYAALYFPLCAITAKESLCAVLLHAAAGLWGAACHFVSLFRGSPVLPWDLTALGTATAVAGSYDLTPTPVMLLALVLVIALAVVLLRWAPGGSFLPKGRDFFHRSLLLMCGVLCVLFALSPKALERLGVKTDVWDPSTSYKTGGALAEFLCNTQFLSVEAPDGYSTETAQMLLNQVQKEDAPTAETVERPNVIAIMNESWADFEEFGHLSLTESVSDYIDNLDNAVRGHSYTSVFGAGTSASEFEFLTGYSMAFLPSGSIPYQQYVLSPTDSLASLFRENGYRTLAIHPGERTSWQRNQAYPLLGFDEFKCVDDMDVPVTEEHGYVSDQSSFSQIIYEFEHKDPEERLFLFNVTIQNHGSYTVEDYPAEVQLTDEPGKYPMAEQYLTLANKTDEAFRLLVDYFSQQEEPTIILMFGDHQPSVEQEFLDKAYGVTQDQMTMEQYMGKYKTPFLIWANYDLPDDEIPTTSLNFLGQYLLSYAGIENSLYENYLQNFQEVLPAMTFVGYIDQNGKAYSHLEQNEYTALIEDYRTLAYDNLFGGQSRHAQYYQAPQ